MPPPLRPPHLYAQRSGPSNGVSAEAGGAMLAGAAWRGTFTAGSAKEHLRSHRHHGGRPELPPAGLLRHGGMQLPRQKVHQPPVMRMRG